MVKGGRNRGAPTSHRRVDGEGGKRKDRLGKSRRRARLPRSAAAASIGGGMTFYLYCSRYFVCVLFRCFSPKGMSREGEGPRKTSVHRADFSVFIFSDV
jgi:hypothetical protein